MQHDEGRQAMKEGLATPVASRADSGQGTGENAAAFARGMDTVSASTRIGTTVARYRLETLLGRGGMSVVYLAEHIRLGRKVALKLLAAGLSDDGDYRERFIRESRRAAELDHPSIIPIFDAGEDNGQLYIAMRYVDGGDLKTLISREGPLNVGRTLFILEQVASALDAAHVHNLIHRDVKPSNILVAEPSDRAYLTDFGVVKHTASHGLTKTGLFIGTVDYAAPEQIEGLSLDGRTDVYALGAVLYECLAGHAPFEHGSELAVLHAHLSQRPPTLTDVRPDLPKALNRVIASAMAKSKEERQDSCHELLVEARRAVLQQERTTASVHLPAATVLPQRPGEGGAAQTTASTDASAPAVLASGPGGAGGSGANPKTGRRPFGSPRFVIALLVVLLTVAAAAAAFFATRSSSAAASGSSTGRHRESHSTPVPGSVQSLVPQQLWKDCTLQKTNVPGAMESAVCRPHVTSGSATTQWEISKFRNAAALDKAYDAALANARHGRSLSSNSGRCDGAGWAGEGLWRYPSGASADEVAGRRFCYFDGTENVIVWSHRSSEEAKPEPNTLMTASAGDSDQAQLFGWWRFWRTRIGEPADASES
jgi:serine/threonine-protein kinase